MSQIDIWVLAGIIMCLVAIGLTGKKHDQSAEDFFLAGRKLPWYQIGFSLFATNFSASAIIGITGAAYLYGIAIYNYEWGGILAIVFFAICLVGVVRKSQAFTISEFLARRYDARIKTIYSVFIIFLIVFVDMAASLYAGGLLLSEIIPGLSLPIVILLVMGLAAAYSLIGGLQAISRTDVFQSVIIIVGAIFITYFAFAKIGGWTAFTDQTPDRLLTLIRSVDDPAVPWTGLVTGVSVLSAYFWLTNQNMVQWVLSAKSQTDARRGLIMAGFLKLIILGVIVLPGVAALQIIPELTQPDRVYPALMLELLPAGILGLVLAGFFAALMSNTDSTLHAASTIVTMDFVKARFPDLPSRTLVWVGRSATLAIIIVSAIWAPMIGNFGTLFEYIQGLLSYAVAPFVVVYLGGIFWPRANSKGALLALLVGLIASLIIGIFQIYGITEIHYLHIPLPLALMSLFGLVIGSLVTKSTGYDKTLTISGHEFDAIPRSDIWMASILVLVTLAQVFVFW